MQRSMDGSRYRAWLLRLKKVSRLDRRRTEGRVWFSAVAPCGLSVWWDDKHVGIALPPAKPPPPETHGGNCYALIFLHGNQNLPVPVPVPVHVPDAPEGKDLLAAACHFVTHLPCSSSTTPLNLQHRIASTAALLVQHLHCSAGSTSQPSTGLLHSFKSPLSYCTHSFHSPSFLLSNPLSHTAQPAASC